MERHEFEEQFGTHGGEIERLLIFEMVSARRCLETMRRENDNLGKPIDRVLKSVFEGQEYHAKIALAAIWTERAK